MAETVAEELQRKLEGATNALEEVNSYIKHYTIEQELLQKRVNDLKLALSALIDDSPSF